MANLNLFEITCNNKKCRYAFMSSSDEHTVCPSCGSKYISYSNLKQYEAKEITLENKIIDIRDYLDDFLDCNEDKYILTALVIASTYMSESSTIASYDENNGLRVVLNYNELVKKLIKSAGLKNMAELESKINKCESIDDVIMLDCMFSFIRRDSYYDENGVFCENVWVKPKDASLIYYWVEDNFKKIVNMLSSKDFGSLKSKVDSSDDKEFEVIFNSKKNIEMCVSFKDKWISSSIKRVKDKICTHTINDYFSEVELKDYGIRCKENEGKIEVSILTKYVPKYSLNIDDTSKEDETIAYINLEDNTNFA